MKNKRFNYITLMVLGLVMVLTGCRKEVYHEYGPRGYDGRVYYGVSYSHFMPYSYGDNNPSIPNNPILGEYYETQPGFYQFEYFINPFEYWHGSYELWVNPGGPGGQFGEPGLDGADNFLMMICNPQGFFEDRYLGKSGQPDEIVKEGEFQALKYRMEIKKSHINDRKPLIPVKIDGSTAYSK